MKLLRPALAICMICVTLLVKLNLLVQNAVISILDKFLFNHNDNDKFTAINALVLNFLVEHELHV